MTARLKGIVTDPDELRDAAAALEAEPFVPTEKWAAAVREHPDWGNVDLTPDSEAIQKWAAALAVSTRLVPPAVPQKKSTLRQRIGDRLAVRLMTKYRREVRDEDLGRRDPEQPSEALSAMEHAVARSEFTPEERATIRTLLGMHVLAGIEGLPEAEQ